MGQDQFRIANRRVDRIDTAAATARRVGSRSVDPGFVVGMSRVDLSKDVRVVMFARYVPGWDTERIAEVLHISTQEVEHRLRVGEEALRRARE